MSKRRYFGTDGIRGKVGTAYLNSTFMLHLGYAAGRVLSRESVLRTVIIGHDTRLSCEMLLVALAEGLHQAGMQVQCLGVLPTPAVAYLTSSLKAAVGIVISASHNLYQDNGIKFFDSHGMKLSDTLECAIEKELEVSKSFKNWKKPEKLQTLMEADRLYVEFCQSLGPWKQGLEGLKLVLDCANGAAFRVAPAVFSELGAEVTTIHCEPDGKNINKDCGVMNLERLQAAILASEADAGLAFDGDGDRLLMVDHTGQVVDGDEILCILATHFLRDNGQGVVGTVMSNRGLEKALSHQGIPFERSPVGDRYVLDALQKRCWSLGGEPSGHIVNLNYTTTGDGIMTGLQVLHTMKKTLKPLVFLKQVMVKSPQVLINIPLDQKIDIASNRGVSEAVQWAEEKLGGLGRILLRLSGTEPLLRVMVEGEDEIKVRQVAQFLAQVLKKTLLSSCSS